jgi:hypothetical protein
MESIVVLQTPHYSFDLKITIQTDPVHKVILSIGNDTCLEATILMPPTDERMKAFGFGKTAHIHQVDALVECAREQIIGNYLEKYSMGQEMLQAIIDYIKANYKHIRHTSLNDKSYMPCNRKDGNTLDLLSYSIAKYGKTWYEMKFNAYPRGVKQYAKEIQVYISPKAKEEISFTNLVHQIAFHNNFAVNTIFKDMDKYTAMYNTAKTFPEFFTALSNDIPRADKCNFFKRWLEIFIYSYVKYDRDWIIDIKQQGGKHKRHHHRRTYKIK